MKRRHPRRTITREIRTRRAVHPERERDELEAVAWPESIKVKDCMTRPVVSVHSDALIWGAAELMRHRKIRHLPVVDREGHLVGIVTDRDLRQVIFDPSIQDRLGAATETLKAMRVREIMTWGVITVRPGADIRAAARLMHEQKIGALPVVERDRVAGILTESDVVKAFVNVLGEGILMRPYRWAAGYR